MSQALRSPTSSSFSALGTAFLFRSRLIRLTIILRLGVTPISNLFEWTDVLHLSSKWGFEHLRTAAITAILPLASAVDKLVLGRTYGFVDWVPGAYMDLLKCTEDLTVAEARRMDVEDIVAVAKGRREARTQNVRPDKDIDEIVKRLIPGPAPALPASTSSPANAPEVVSPLGTEAVPSRQLNIDQVSANSDDRAKISRWVGQMSCSSSQGAAQECLVKFMQEDRARVPLVLDMVLASGLASVTRALERGGKLMVPHPHKARYTETWDSTADGGCYLRLYNMHAKDKTLGLINSAQIEKAYLYLADNWSALKEMINIDVSANDWLATPVGKSINSTLTYLAYLNDGPGSYENKSFSVIRASAFSSFWVELTSVFKSTPSSCQLDLLAYRTSALLKKHGARISKLAVSPEMDTFYLVVEEIRDAAKGRRDQPTLVALLEVNSEMSSSSHASSNRVSLGHHHDKNMAFGVSTVPRPGWRGEKAFAASWQSIISGSNVYQQTDYMRLLASPMSIIMSQGVCTAVMFRA
jgi:hypothetical protein